MVNEAAHLAITASIHNTLATIADALRVPMPSLGDAVLDDVMHAYDQFEEKL